MDAAEWSVRQLRRGLLEAGFAPGRCGAQVVVPAIEAWFALRPPGVNATDWLTVSLAYTPGDSTVAAEPPEPVPAGAWFGLAFSREFDTSDRGEHGVELWYPSTPAWHALTTRIDWQPDRLLAFEALGEGPDDDGALLRRADIAQIVAVAASEPVFLARIFGTWLDDERPVLVLSPTQSPAHP